MKPSPNHRTRTGRTIAAILLALVLSGCDWGDALYGLAVLNGGIVVLDDHRNNCDEWYDFADPDCY